MHHAGACSHALNIAATDYRTITHAVLVLKRTLNDVGHNLHVFVAVRTKPL